MSHQQLRSYGDVYRTGKNRFNTLFLFFINWVGRVISLDCQYIIRVAESCSNYSLHPKSDYLIFYMYSTRDYIRLWEARWPSGRASDSGARGLGFDTHSGRRVSFQEQDTLTSQKSTGNTRKRWLRPDMTEKLLTGT